MEDSVKENVSIVIPVYNSVGSIKIISEKIVLGIKEFIDSLNHALLILNRHFII